MFMYAYLEVAGFYKHIFVACININRKTDVHMEGNIHILESYNFRLQYVIFICFGIRLREIVVERLVLATKEV